MATTIGNTASPAATNSRARSGDLGAWGVIRKILLPLSSLRLTVVLLALAIFIVLAGTLAQTRADVWVVVRDYFRTSITWIELRDFSHLLAKAVNPQMTPWPGAIPFPGGWLIGTLMAVNLLAAHTVRFTSQARGARLWAGLAALLAGVLVTTAVILGGSGEGLQAEPLVSWRQLWTVCKLALAFVGVAGVWVGLVAANLSAPVRRLCLILGAVTEVTAVVLFALGDRVFLGDSSMRILWQLIQGGMAGLVLLAGCWLIFGKRAGIVLLHGGIGLLMFSEILVGLKAEEAQMHIKEGETINYVQDIREVELAVIDRTDPGSDTTVAIPQSRLTEPFEATEHPLFTRSFCRKLPEGLRGLLGCRTGEPVIRDPRLPFDVRVVKYLQNSRLAPVGSEKDEKNLATKGFGNSVLAAEIPAGTGVKSEAVDDSAAYVEFLKKGTEESLGVYLFSLLQSRFQDSRERSGWSDAEVRSNMPPFLYQLSVPQEVTVDGKSYQVALRFKRSYKPFAVKLTDVRFDKYLGTNTAKNYSSDVVLTDESSGTNVPRHIWMNNPLRYGGETFYQSNYMQDPITGEEATGLQVVSNTGWMIPYVSCMIVAVGMIFQFGITLSRYLGRVATGQIRVGGVSAAAPEASGDAGSSLPGVSARPAKLDWVLAGAGLLFCVGIIYAEGFRSTPDEGGFDFKLAGRIPIAYEGRVKPLDTLARNTLQIMSDKDRVPDRGAEKLQAIRWILDVMSGSEEADSHRVFRIDNPEVLDFFGLDRRKGYLYSRKEIAGKAEAFHAEVDRLRKEKKPEDMNVYERKLLELERRVRAFTSIEATMRLPPFPEQPDAEMVQTVRQSAGVLRSNLALREERLLERHPPLAVPVRAAGAADGDYTWKPLVSELTADYFFTKVLKEQESAPAVAAWNEILSSYSRGKSGEFNRAVQSYLTHLSSETPAEYRPAKTAFEAFYNRVSPFQIAWTLYIVAFIGTALGWLLALAGYGRSVQWATFISMLAIFALHTAGLIGRIYISGRPPVTNLYSSAVFIGWGCVLFGIVLEWIFRMGVGNAIASVAGFATLYISFKLAGDGDTFTVMQAVLDTQFWLATHVVCIALGYTATFVAGGLGVIYILHGMFTPFSTPQVRQTLTSMTYGTLCFAIILSFVGTVLGGLWADDSWGRFWGWDPKENGALIIVLWNALVLHARWGGMVKERGLAALAVGGNIVTAWSWFGVNELGVGLHSYGFTEGVLFKLFLFAVSQLFVIAVACLPRDWWWSAQATALPALAAGPGDSTPRRAR